MELHELIKLHESDPEKAKEELSKLSCVAQLIWLLKPEIEWLIPPGLPEGFEYNPAPKSTLVKEIRRVRAFFWGKLINTPVQYPQFKKFRLEEMYLSLLRAIPQCEAELLEEFRAKKLDKYSWVNSSSTK